MKVTGYLWLCYKLAPRLYTDDPVGQMGEEGTPDAADVSVTEPSRGGTLATVSISGKLGV